MNDDQLTAEIRRRAQSRPVPDLLPAVRTAIDTRPQPVISSRLAPLAGLVGICAVILLLVVALPRLTPGPSATESPTVLTTAYFAARLAAGDLNGQTLLVSGRIEAAPRRGPACRVDETCYFGTLVASEPPVDVVASAVPTVADDPLATTSSGAGEWAWWRRLQGPVEGVLVLAVDEESRVEFIGVSQQGEGQTTLGDVRSIDIESLAVEDVLVVTAWLGGGNRVPCPPQVYEVTRIPGLPGSLCHKPSWLHDDQFAPTSQVLVPEAALQVQNLAYGQFAAEPTYDDQGIAQPEEGTYALARRLQGWCDGESAPCWRWNVVARLTPPSDEGPHVSPEPTPSQIATPQIAPSPALEAASLGCARSVDYPSLLPGPSGPVISIVDHTGYVDSCTSWASEGPALVDRTDPNLAVIWQGTACDTDVELQFRSAGNRFELASTSPPIECDSPASHGLIIRFTQPMPTELIDVYLGSESPIPTQSVTTRTVECTGAAPPPEPGAVSIEDHTGLIKGCEVSGAETPETTTLMSTTDPPTLTMTWLSPCASDVALTKLGFWHRPQAERDHVLAPELSPYVLVADRADPTGPIGCYTMVTGRQVALTLEHPIDAADVELLITDNGRGVANSLNEPELFRLVLEAGTYDYAIGEPIDLSVTLTYSGGFEETLTFADHRGPILGFEQLDGELAQYTHITTADCSDAGPITLRGDEVRAMEYRKVAGWSGSDPNADMYRAYGQDPQLRLPPGTYRLFVSLNMWMNGICGESTARDLSLQPSVIIHVREDDGELKPIECRNASGNGLLTSVSDRSKTVESCVSLAPSAEERASLSSPQVVNPNGDQSKLRVLASVSCARSFELTMVRGTSDRWEVELLDPGSILLCARVVAIELSLARPVPAEQVDFTLITP